MDKELAGWMHPKSYNGSMSKERSVTSGVPQGMGTLQNPYY